MSDESKGSGKVEFKPPQDFRPPENIAAGKEFDLVCSFQVKPDGSLCMTKLGDTDMPGYGEKQDQNQEGEQKYKPGYGEYAKTMTADADVGGGGGNPNPSPSY